MVRPEGGEGTERPRPTESMARAPPGLMGALLLLLLLLLSSAEATPAPPPAGALGHLRGYLGQVSSAGARLLERLSLPEAQQRIRTAYEQGATAVVTYTGILTDQLYHMWQGEQ